MSDPIRILEVNATLDCGGAENMIMNMYRNMDREKILLDFVVHKEDKCFFTDEVLSMGSRIFTAPKFTGKNFFAYRNWWKEFLNKENYKVIHIHASSISGLFVDLARDKGITIVLHSHNTVYAGNIIQRNIKRIITKIALNKVDYFFGCSDAAGISYFGKKVFNQSNYYTFKNGIKTDNFVFNNEIRKKCRENLIVDDELLIGHVGSFTYQKNHMFLLDVFKAVKVKHPKAKLMLVGEGELRSKIESKISELGLEKDVIMTGLRKDVNELLMAMDVFLFPSHFEGLSVVLVEAQATDLRCIVSSSISPEHELIDKLEFVSLNENAEYWANRVIDECYKRKRCNVSNKIRTSGYDVAYTAKWLEDFYINLVNRTRA